LPHLDVPNRNVRPARALDHVGSPATARGGQNDLGFAEIEHLLVADGARSTALAVPVRRKKHLRDAEFFADLEGQPVSAAGEAGDQEGRTGFDDRAAEGRLVAVVAATSDENAGYVSAQMRSWQSAGSPAMSIATCCSRVSERSRR
jgi:hypothetical protein